MSVTFVRSGLMMTGKFPEAHQFMEDRVKWLHETFDVQSSIMTLLGGPVGRIALVSDLDSVAQIEEIRRKIIGGAAPEAMTHGQEGLFVPGQTMDRIWLKV